MQPGRVVKAPQKCERKLRHEGPVPQAVCSHHDIDGRRRDDLEQEVHVGR
jgi:hypothetical protein